MVVKQTGFLMLSSYALRQIQGKGRIHELLKILLHLQLLRIAHQVWVLYGQASRAISIS